MNPQRGFIPVYVAPAKQQGFRWYPQSAEARQGDQAAPLHVWAGFHNPGHVGGWDEPLATFVTGAAALDASEGIIFHYAPAQSFAEDGLDDRDAAIHSSGG